MYINLTYLFFWLLFWSLIGHQVIIKKIRKTIQKHGNSKTEMARTMIHLVMTIAILPLEVVFNFLSKLEKRGVEQ